MVDFKSRDLRQLVREMGAAAPSEELLNALLAHADETGDAVLRGLVTHYLLVYRIAQELLARHEQLRQLSGQPLDELLQLAQIVLRNGAMPPEQGSA
jgi:DNA repair protein RadC